MKSTKIILIFSFSVLVASYTHAQLGVGITISSNIAPPALPAYIQPPCPADGYLWSPGYWAYSGGAYFWVPGVWVLPPQIGYLWTPPYWGYADGIYGFYDGYWGPHVGFYGGINYGYGYSGSGFGGGRWEGNLFRYNTAVVKVNQSVVHNTYIDRTVIIHNTTVINNRTSFNGGPHGNAARPSAQEEAALRERHLQATAQQASHFQRAQQDKNQFASVNHGHPLTTAMNKPGGRAYRPGNNRGVSNPYGVTHPIQYNRPAPVGSRNNNHPQPVQHNPEPRQPVQHNSEPRQPGNASPQQHGEAQRRGQR